MNKIRRFLPASVAFLLAATNLLLITPASAAQLNAASVRLDRMSAATNTTFRLLVKPATASQTSLSINFNGSDSTTWTGSGGTVTGTSETTSTTQCTADGYTAIGGTPSFSSSSGATIAVTGLSGMTSTTTTYCLDFTNAASLKTPSAGEYHPLVTVGSDSTTIAVRIVTNDQIVVTATVAPTFNFALSANADTLGTLTTGAVAASSGVTATVNTNAKNGWVAWIKDASSGLNSASANKTIASATAGSAASLTAGTEGYGVGIGTINQGSGTGTTSGVAAYTSANGGGVDGTLRQVASSTGTAGNASFIVKEYAAISATTAAASDYTDTITVVGAGSF